MSDEQTPVPPESDLPETPVTELPAATLTGRVIPVAIDKELSVS